MNGASLNRWLFQFITQMEDHIPLVFENKAKKMKNPIFYRIYLNLTVKNTSSRILCLAEDQRSVYIPNLCCGLFGKY